MDSEALNTKLYEKLFAEHKLLLYVFFNRNERISQ